ncbi:MAG TPA: heat-inducible transcriptional repressor HrcA [Gemmatimonadales bacterium]|nr:heat-inducible transcriptional repressor HrcA [Gemmatimonadales bacterium]
MPSHDPLNDRQARVLEAVIQAFIQTAEPAASQAVVQRSGLGVSSATVRNTMSELEEKGYLFHPHASAGRIPTDLAYRWYVDNLMRLSPPSREERDLIKSEMPSTRTAVEEILRRAAQVLGVLTQELGVAVGPSFDQVVLERVDLAQVATDRLLLVLNLRSGTVRTIFVQVAGTIAADSVQRVAQILNERLAGLTLKDIRASLGDRLRDADHSTAGRELLNIFIAEADELLGLGSPPEAVMLGSAQMLAEQPEFASNDRMRDLLDLTERRDRLHRALEVRHTRGLTITIGGENTDPRLAGFTLITSAYRTGDLSGVIGVIGPTRMPYDKIIGLVDHTSRLVEGLME